MSNKCVFLTKQVLISVLSLEKSLDWKCFKGRAKDRFPLLATLVVESTMKVNRLNLVKNIGLAGLPIMHTRIPINPLKFVRVCIVRASRFSGKKGNFCAIDDELFSECFPQSPLSKLMKKGEEFEEEPPEKEELDWWSKYYASLEEIERKVGNQFERKSDMLVL